MTAQKRRLVHNSGNTQYELFIGDERVGYVDYELSGDLVVMHSTFVDDDHKGQGLGGEIVAAAMDDVRAQGRKIIVQCPFIEGWLNHHPQYRDLLA